VAFSNFLRSINKQNCGKVRDGAPKVIVVDSSADYSKTYIDVACQRLGVTRIRIKYIDLPDGAEWNKSAALNIGLGAAKTKYVMFTDADCVFQPNFFTEVGRRMSSSSCLLCAVHALDEFNKPRAASFIHDVMWSSNDAWELAYQQLRNLASPVDKAANGACQVLPRKWALDVGGFDEKMCMWGGMDNDLVNRARAAGLNIVRLDDVTSILHQPHSVSKFSGPHNIFFKKNNARMLKKTKNIADFIINHN